MHVFSRQRSDSLGLLVIAGTTDGRRPTGSRRASGFSLIELLTALVVSAVLIAIAIPNFRVLILNYRLTTAANDVIAAINTARIEAIKRNGSTQFCSNNASNNLSDALGTKCGTQTGAVYASYTPAGGPAAATTVEGPINSLAVTPLQLHGDATALRFTSQGIAQVAGGSTPFGATVIDICTSQLSSNNHRVITMIGGSTLTISQSSVGSCP
jgi:type IV fimbrial biogenesis protein FimT